MNLSPQPDTRANSPLKPLCRDHTQSLITLAPRRGDEPGPGPVVLTCSSRVTRALGTPDVRLLLRLHLHNHFGFGIACGGRGQSSGGCARRTPGTAAGTPMRPAPLTGSGVGGLLLLPWAAVTVGVVLRLGFDDELGFDACGRKDPAHTSCSGDGQGPAGATRCRWGASSSVPPAAGAPGNHGAAAAAGHWGSKAPIDIK